MVYAELGGQTECIMGNWKIVNRTGVVDSDTCQQQQSYSGLRSPGQLSTTTALFRATITRTIVNNNSPIQGYVHQDNCQQQQSYSGLLCSPGQSNSTYF